PLEPNYLSDGALQDAREGSSQPPRPPEARRASPPSSRLPQEDRSRALPLDHRQARHPQVIGHQSGAASQRRPLGFACSEPANPPPAGSHHSATADNQIRSGGDEWPPGTTKEIHGVQ